MLNANAPNDFKKVTSFSISFSLDSLYLTAREARDWGEMDTTMTLDCSPFLTYGEGERRDGRLREGGEERWRDV